MIPKTRSPTELAQLDQQYVWHPFTQMGDWLSSDPIVIVRGQGAILEDAKGNSYLDANSSIWTNLHGHNNPQINAAIIRQLAKISHSSALGLANEPASLLAARLIEISRLAAPVAAGPPLSKVFFSDDGSTAMEVALKLAYEYARRVAGQKNPRFLSLQGSYHGDTIGAVSLGHIDLFHRAYRGLLFKSDQVMAPYCYRCPFNRAAPERGDARDYRRCHWECVGQVEQRFQAEKKTGHSYAGIIVEPLIQGAAGMIPQPEGWLKRVDEIRRAFETPMIADEVMTGFGRTGPVFAVDSEAVQPDFIALAKGLTGGYLPMAATLTTQRVFDAFLGKYSEFKTFFHGHSFTGNQLGSAAALASLDILSSPASQSARTKLAVRLKALLSALWSSPHVGDIRQTGLVAGIELVRDWRTRSEFELKERAGIRVCEKMAARGVLTRPIGNVVVLMPPYCATLKQLEKMVLALRESIEETFAD